MQDLKEFKNCFDRELNINESILNEFFVSPEETIREFGLNSETNWSNPSILPNKFDLTWQRWFRRIGTWGKITILHVDPEKNKRENISQDTFIKRMGNAELLKVYGKWEVQQSKIYRMEFWNRYIGMNGKEYKEIIQINVDLIPELRKGLHWGQWIF